MSEYKSEFEVEPYSIVGRKVEGTQRVTTVVIEGELMQFEISAATVFESLALYMPREQQL